MRVSSFSLMFFRACLNKRNIKQAPPINDRKLPLKFSLKKVMAGKRKHFVKYLPILVEASQSIDQEMIQSFMAAKEFDQKFDDGEDIAQFFDLSKAKRQRSEQKTLSVELPVWMIELINQ